MMPPSADWARTVLCGHPALGIRGADGSLQGIALAEDRLVGVLTRLRDFPVELSLYPAYLRPLGQQSLQRLQAYRRASQRAQKRRFSMVLVKMGVAEEARGLGYGYTREATTELDGLKVFVFHDHKGEAAP